MTPSSTTTTRAATIIARRKLGDQKRQRVADSAQRGHESANDAARPRMAAAGEAAIVGERLRKAHADARAERCRQPHLERIETALRGQRRGEHRRQRGDRPIHQSSQPGLHDLQYEQAPVGFVLAVLDVGLQLGLLQLLGAILVRALFLRQIVQQLANAGVLRAGGGLLVEAAALHFHGAGLIADGVEAERLHQPDRIAMHEAAHVLAADQRDMLAELLAK